MILGENILGHACVAGLGHDWLVGWMAIKPLLDGTGLLAGTDDFINVR